jgi:small subunit ribosomal protein S19
MEIKKKEFKYRGKTIEELQALDVREFAEYLPARKRRTVLRNFQAHEDFVSKVKLKNSKKKPTKTHIRDLVVVPALVGMKLQVYNGNKFVPVEITGEMLGCKFGEFAPTRAKIVHTTLGKKVTSVRK